MHYKVEGTTPSLGQGTWSRYYQIFVVIVAAMGGLLFGFDMAVISGTLSYLRGQFGLSAALEGWVVSSAILACVLGAAISGVLSDRFGRKMVLITSGILFTISAYGCTVADSITSLVIFRFLGGVGVGIASMVSPLYISEISPSNIRGSLVSLYQLAITIGIVLAYFSNAWVLRSSTVPSSEITNEFLQYIILRETWRGMFFVGLLPSLLFTISLLFVPESPRWLIKNGNPEKALGILEKMMLPAMAVKEVIQIQDAIAEESGSFRHLFTGKLRKALYIGIFLALFSELSGITIVMYYGPDIFSKAGFTLGNALGGAVVLGLINVFFTLIAIWKIDSIGRRPLLFVGTAGAFVSLLATGVLLSLGSLQGVAIVMLLGIFVACFAFSMGPIKWVVMSEIFPTKIRGQAMSIATLTVWLAVTFLTFIFPIIRDSKHVGVAGSFFLFSACLFPQFFFIWKQMPETKGKSLEELARFWRD